MRLAHFRRLTTQDGSGTSRLAPKVTLLDQVPLTLTGFCRVVRVTLTLSFSALSDPELPLEYPDSLDFLLTTAAGMSNPSPPSALPCPPAPPPVAVVEMVEFDVLDGRTVAAGDPGGSAWSGTARRLLSACAASAIKRNPIAVAAGD
eukprot:CAMPEP_0115399108 /NCGR_PEP_ID=MMETSP0271-20121206/14667_1 /TAXON_ID=71861 /ORGANISM="Scrippsiella trochoidea, Strain CCMP3099" /LENGTH=146 /DNA_ID=CAMNT_0002822911 /DNA_START=538 /DNA_END=975 /DNA_ORIENTATION=-